MTKIAAKSNNKVTIAEFICMLPQMVSFEYRQMYIKRWNFMQRKEKNEGTAYFHSVAANI